MDTIKQSEGFCECKKAPMGEHGLEGFQLKGLYFFEKLKKKENYFRVYPVGGNFYYETVGPYQFAEFFDKKSEDFGPFNSTDVSRAKGIYV